MAADVDRVAFDGIEVGVGEHDVGSTDGWERVERHAERTPLREREAQDLAAKHVALVHQLPHARDERPSTVGVGSDDLHAKTRVRAVALAPGRDSLYRTTLAEVRAGRARR